VLNRAIARCATIVCSMPEFQLSAASHTIVDGIVHAQSAAYTGPGHLYSLPDSSLSLMSDAPTPYGAGAVSATFERPGETQPESVCFRRSLRSHPSRRPTSQNTLTSCARTSSPALWEPTTFVLRVASQSRLDRTAITAVFIPSRWGRIFRVAYLRLHLCEKSGSIRRIHALLCACQFGH